MWGQLLRTILAQAIPGVLAEIGHAVAERIRTRRRARAQRKAGRPDVPAPAPVLPRCEAVDGSLRCSLMIGHSGPHQARDGETWP